MKVLIRITRTTEYATTVEMSKEEFDAYNERLLGNIETRRKAERELNKKIDVRDWQDDDFHRLEEFEPITEE